MMLLQEAAHRYLSRMLLTFSNLCDEDADIAACLTFMRVQAPPGEALWNAENVRSLMRSAFAAVTSASPYALPQPTQSAADYCLAVANTIKARKDAKQ